MNNPVVSGNSEVLNKEKPFFPVYLINSKWSLERIDTFLKGYGNSDDEDGGVGFLRIVYDKNGQETPRNIAILEKYVYDNLCKDGYNQRQYGKGVHIAPYNLLASNFPTEGKTTSLFIPVPNELCNDDDRVLNSINEKLKHLSLWNILPEDSWSVSAPLKSREKGVINGGCFVSFKRDVSLDARAMTRVLLTDTYWPESPDDDNDERPIFRCFWARARKETPVKTSSKKEPTVQATEETKEVKKREAIHKVVKKAKPVPKKATTVPILTTSQPTLK